MVESVIALKRSLGKVRRKRGHQEFDNRGNRQQHSMQDDKMKIIDLSLPSTRSL
jgi:hypothetical protein